MSTHGIRLGYRGWIAMLLMVCAFPFVAIAQPPAWDTVTLPAGIAGTLERFSGEEIYLGRAAPEEPYQREVFEMHRDWIRSELFMQEGSFGWQLHDFTMDTFDESITYNLGSQRGSRMNRLALYGDSRCDGITPISWIRKLHVRSKHGESVEVEYEDDFTIYTCQGAKGRGKFRVYVEPSGRVVRAEELHPKSEDIRSVYAYEDWVSLGEAGEHPQTIRTVIYPDLKALEQFEKRMKNYTPDPSARDPVYTVVTIQEMHPLAEDAEPTGYTLPVEAIITDYIDNVLRDGEGTIIGDLSDATEAPAVRNGPNTPFRVSSNWLAGVGVLLLVGAAVIWEYRRRRG